MVVTVGLRNEAVVGWVVHGAEENSVKFKKSCNFVELILGLASLGNLDDSVDYLRSLLSRAHPMPRVMGKLWMHIHDLGYD